ncbi:MAG: glycosyltransferase family 4 protein [Thermoanaerobaculia bacterium]
MRIAQVSPLYESVPPRGYGGTERMVSYLTEELVRQGHEVTLFASGDSHTRAELIAPCPRALRTDPDVVDPIEYHVLATELVAQKAGCFDVIHSHLGVLALPLLRRLAVPHVTTLHGRLDTPDLPPVWSALRDSPVISISDHQRRPLPFLDWRGTIHHGLPEGLRTFRPAPEDYLLFIGRISPEKRPDRAIEIARRAGLPLKIASKVDPADRLYFETTIAPLMEQPHVESFGEVAGPAKDRLLGGARALLFPIDWPEPFGLVMIEALACGTPVVAWNEGSVPEILTDGVDGFVVESVEEAVRAVARIDTLDRRACRRTFEERFSARRMARDYLELYQDLVAGTAPPDREARGFRLVAPGVPGRPAGAGSAEPAAGPGRGEWPR